MQIVSGIMPKATKAVLYGPEGIGKSTFASMAPNPLYIDTEGSTTRLNVRRIQPAPESWTMILEQVRYVLNNPSVCGTLILDTADWAQKHCIDSVCAQRKMSSIPDSWALQMPNAKEMPITLTCVTYVGTEEIGRSTATAKIKTPATFAPQISFDVVDINPTTIALTGNASRLIRGASTARATIEATPLRGATIKSTKINGVSTAALEVEAVQNGKFVFSATDSRGYTTEQAVSMSIIPYIPLTAIIEAERGTQGTNGLTVTVKGNYYAGSIAGTENALAFQYRADGGAWQNATPDIDGNTYSVVLNLELDYQTAHGLYFRISDKLTTLNPSQHIPRAVPQTMEGDGWIRNNVPVWQVLSADEYTGRGDPDETGLETWLNGLLADMPNAASRTIRFVCSAVTGYTICAQLYKHDSSYASVLGHSYDGYIYHKTLYNGAWSATKKGAINQ